MMAAMMLPSVTPVASLYAKTVQANRTTRIAGLVMGYLGVWAASGLPAYGLAWLAGGCRGPGPESGASPGQRALPGHGYVTNQPDRQGFAYGTLPGHPECGEEAFIVEQHDDGAVTFAITAFSRPATLQAKPLACRAGPSASHHHALSARASRLNPIAGRNLAHAAGQALASGRAFPWCRAALGPRSTRSRGSPHALEGTPTYSSH